MIMPIPIGPSSEQCLSWLAILLDASAKGAVILLAAAALALFLRRNSASLRHMIWTLSVLGLLCLPILSAALPQWRVPLLPAWAAPQVPAPNPATPPAEPEPAPSAIAINPHEPPSQTEASTPAPSAVPLPVVIETSPAPAPLALPPSPPPAPPGPPALAPSPLPALALLVWAIGVVLMLGSLLIGTATIAWQTRRAGRIAEPNWLSLLQSLREVLSIRRPVALLRSNWPAVPYTSGIFRPAIILPPEADGWPDDRRRVVLLHELAHVKRLDCLTQLIARVARALYWFNPLIWLACRMLRLERERACDDLVLSSGPGTKPSDYAAHLLDIVRTLHTSRFPSLGAVAMAKRSQLEGRVIFILDPKRNRRRLTRLGAAIATLVVASIVVPISIMRATAADQPAPATQPALQPIDIHYSIYLMRLDVHITVSPAGLLRSVTTRNKSYGPNDIPKTEELIETREGQLTADQIDKLIPLFAGWEKLADKYGSVPDGPELDFRYGEKRIVGGSEAPRQVRDAWAAIKTLAESMPLLAAAATTRPRRTPRQRHRSSQPTLGRRCRGVDGGRRRPDHRSTRRRCAGRVRTEVPDRRVHQPNEDRSARTVDLSLFCLQ